MSQRTVTQHFSRRLVACGLITGLLVGLSAGCSHKQDPHAVARAKAQDQAASMRAESRQLEVKADSAEARAEQVRVVAEAMWADGKTIVLAGLARQEQGDPVGGKRLEDRGHVKMEKAARQLELADQMDDRARAARDKAASLVQKAQTVLASVPMD